MDDNGYTDKWFTKAARFNRLVLCCALIALILAMSGIDRLANDCFAYLIYEIVDYTLILHEREMK